MKLLSLLRTELIRIDDTATTKEEVIINMTERFFKVHRLSMSKELVLKALFDREKLGGTVFPTGIAIPHARFPDFDDLIIGISIPEKPIHTDGEEVRCFVVILTSLAASNIYLQTLAQFIKISQNTDLFEKLVSSNNTQEFLHYLTDIKVKKELTVEDIMDRDPCIVTPETTLKELADTFYKYNVKYAPVINIKGDFIGEVSINDLIKVGIPDYALMIGNLKFLSTLEPFERLLRDEEKIMVKDIMRKPMLVINPGTSVIEAALEITRGKRSHLPVVENGQIVGILHITDILNKVIRG